MAQKRKFNKQQIAYVFKHASDGVKVLAEKYQVSGQTIRNILKGRCYQDLAPVAPATKNAM